MLALTYFLSPDLKVEAPMLSLTHHRKQDPMAVVGGRGATCQRGLPGAVKPASVSERSQSLPPRCRTAAGMSPHFLRNCMCCH